jgi:hypothetical protein
MPKSTKNQDQQPNVFSDKRKQHQFVKTKTDFNSVDRRQSSQSRKTIADSNTATSNPSSAGTGAVFASGGERAIRSMGMTHSTGRTPEDHSNLKFPMKGNMACKMLTDEFLTDYERTEIEDFEDVWFVARTSKKHKPTKLERLVNNGFDDQEGYYRHVEGDQIGYRYEVEKVIGKGAFGNVIRCVDHKRQKQVAIKIVKN